MHHEIVALERVHQPLPETFDFGPSTTYTITEYQRTDPATLASRVRNASIIIVTTVRITAEIISPSATPHLQLIAIMATGTDLVDLEACKKRGLRVTNCPGANLEAVSEHAISLYFSARRRTVLLDRATRQVPSEWKEKGSLTSRLKFPDGKPPLICGEEVLGIIGYGGLGKRIAHLGTALGMQVLVSDRKAAPVSPDGPQSTPALDAAPTGPQQRLPFNEVLRRSTVLALALPKTPETLDLLSTPEFEAMSPYAVVVNISRGGIVDEHAVVQAVKNGHIAGYATDVFRNEPLEGPSDSPLLSDEAKDLNITLSPHLAWFSQRAQTNLGLILKNTVEAWVAGDPINVVV